MSICLLASSPVQRQVSHTVLKALVGANLIDLARSTARVRFPSGALIAKQGDPMEALLFVESGVISVLAGPRHCGVEVGTIGPNGVIGVPALCGADRAEETAVARSSVDAHSVDRTILISLFERSPDLRRRLLRYDYMRWEQARILCCCNARHNVEQRVARWILSATDSADEVRATHDDLASALGVRRASVTVGLHVLEGKLAIRLRRQRITIRDRNALEAASCGCHRQLTSGERPKLTPSTRTMPALTAFA